MSLVCVARACRSWHAHDKTIRVSPNRRRRHSDVYADLATTLVMSVMNACMKQGWTENITCEHGGRQYWLACFAVVVPQFTHARTHLLHIFATFRRALRIQVAVLSGPSTGFVRGHLCHICAKPNDSTGQYRTVVVLKGDITRKTSKRTSLLRSILFATTIPIRRLPPYFLVSAI